MKPLEQLNDVERARLLFQLFPGDIPGLITFVNGMCLTLLEDVERHRASWDLIFPFEAYMLQVNITHRHIQDHASKILRDPGFFASTLFGIDMSMFNKNCLMLYIKTRQHPNTRFVTAAHLFFSPS